MPPSHRDTPLTGQATAMNIARESEAGDRGPGTGDWGQQCCTPDHARKGKQGAGGRGFDNGKSCAGGLDSYLVRKISQFYETPFCSHEQHPGTNTSGVILLFRKPDQPETNEAVARKGIRFSTGRGGIQNQQEPAIGGRLARKGGSINKTKFELCSVIKSRARLLTLISTPTFSQRSC